MGLTILNWFMKAKDLVGLKLFLSLSDKLYIYLVSEDVNKKFILESRKGYSHRCPCKIAKMILKQVRTLAFIMIRPEINGKLSLQIPNLRGSLLYNLFCFVASLFAGFGSSSGLLRRQRYQVFGFERCF